MKNEYLKLVEQSNNQQILDEGAAETLKKLYTVLTKPDAEVIHNTSDKISQLEKELADTKQRLELASKIVRLWLDHMKSRQDTAVKDFSSIENLLAK